MKEPYCLGCGCTESRACPGGCSWLFLNSEKGIGICSSCPIPDAAKRSEELAPDARELMDSLIDHLIMDTAWGAEISAQQVAAGGTAEQLKLICRDLLHAGYLKIQYSREQKAFRWLVRMADGGYKPFGG